MTMGCCRKHPFFCDEKGVRKSAWETPECLSAEDWSLIAELREASTIEGLRAIIYRDSETSDAFYCRLIGWPEGLRYMRDDVYSQTTGWPALTRAGGPLARAFVALDERALAALTSPRP